MECNLLEINGAHYLVLACRDDLRQADAMPAPIKQDAEFIREPAVEPFIDYVLTKVFVAISHETEVAAKING
jgi:hypothetical protein